MNVYFSITYEIKLIKSGGQDSKAYKRKRASLSRDIQIYKIFTIIN